MHIFVTGGTGFFGKALLRYLNENRPLEYTSLRLTLLSRDPGRFRASFGELLKGLDVKLLSGDILKPQSLPPGNYTHILHAAADSTFGPQLTPLQRYEQIVDGTRNILNFAISQNVKRVLLTSSGGVYGPQPEDMDQIPETYNGIPEPLNAQNAYSFAKRCAEHLCALYRDKYELDIVIARCFAFVGRDLPLNVHFAIGNFIRDALIANKITVTGDGNPIRSFMDQRDLADWLFKILLKGLPGEAYNVGSDKEISIRDLALLVRDMIAPDKPIMIEGNIIENSFRKRYVPSIKKAQTDLGLSLNFTLKESLQEVLKFTNNQLNK